MLVRIAYPGTKPDELRCYEADGKLRWSFQNQRTLQFGHRSFMHQYEIKFFAAPLRGEDGQRYVLVVVTDWTYFPCGVLLLDPRDGKRRAEYWHPGRFFGEACFFADCDNDGWEELLLGGINNPGPGPGRPALVVFDVPFPPGDPRTPNLFGLPSGQEKVYVLFGRTDVWDALKVPVTVAQVRSAATGTFRLEVGRHRPTILLQTDRFFRITGAVPGAGFQLFHRNLEAEGLLDHELTYEEILEALRPLYFRRAPNANDPESLRHGSPTLEAILE